MIENSNRNKENEKESNQNECPNVLFICKKCKSTPLLLPSNIDEKIVKYCLEERKLEVITPINLLDMTNLKCIKKKLMPKDKLTTDAHAINSRKFICSLHGKEFISYCSDCNKDICFSCSQDHFNHEIFYFSKLYPSAKDIREGNKIVSEMKRELEKFKQSTKETIKNCESLIHIKEIILNSLKSIDFDKLNFYSIMNYKNILKIKFKLFEKQYEVINSMHEMNSTIFLKIKNCFEFEKKECFKGNLELNNVLSEFDINHIKIDNKEPNSYKEIKCFPEQSSQSGANNFCCEKMDKIYNKSNEKALDSKQNKSKKDKFINDIFSCKNCNINKKEDNIELKSDNMNVKILLGKNFVYNNYHQSSYISDFDKSMIVDNQQLLFIINIISSRVKRNVKKLYLCYRATRDGDKAISFHEKCYRLKNIIILISTNNGKKFGGFSSESWDSNNQELWKKDEDAFIFSLNNYNFYSVINPERALFCHKDYGPVFGDGEILIPNNFFSTPSTCLEKNVFFKSNDNSYPLSGKKEFYVTQIEAYKIDYAYL
mgnify:FL=1